MVERPGDSRKFIVTATIYQDGMTLTAQFFPALAKPCLASSAQ